MRKELEQDNQELQQKYQQKAMCAVFGAAQFCFKALLDEAAGASPAGLRMYPAQIKRHSSEAAKHMVCLFIRFRSAAKRSLAQIPVHPNYATRWLAVCRQTKKLQEQFAMVQQENDMLRSGGGGPAPLPAVARRHALLAGRQR